MEEQLNDHKVCIVCDQSTSRIYSLSNCTHQFCKECCIEYIKTQADNFSKAKCLQQGCGAALNQSGPIYSLLDEKTKLKLAKFDDFQYLRKNQNAKACKMPDCNGFFLLTESNCECKRCHSAHCKKCMQLIHTGQCSTKNEEELKKLNYRKCPKCTIWVQKIAGCEYISCKCGIEFCYSCGAEFSKDPCRKRKLWDKQMDVRQLLKKIQFKQPESLQDCCMLLLRFITSLIVILPFTIIFCSVPVIFLFCLVTGVILVLSPCILCQPLSSVENQRLRCFGYLCFLVFYPLIGALFACLFTIIIIIYPFCRNRYHHGVYDPFDIGVATMTVWYLQFVAWVLCC